MRPEAELEDGVGERKRLLRENERQRAEGDGAGPGQEHGDHAAAHANPLGLARESERQGYADEAGDHRRTDEGRGVRMLVGEVDRRGNHHQCRKAAQDDAEEMEDGGKADPCLHVRPLSHGGHCRWCPLPDSNRHALADSRF